MSDKPSITAPMVAAPPVTTPLVTTPLITVAELADLLAERPGSGSVPVLLDVRWTLAGSDRDGYLAAHIPGAVFVDLDLELAGAPGEGGRHPLPDAADLQAVWRAAGINDASTVVVYDGGNGLAASRAWWLLRWSGLREVRLLDGGLAAWTSNGDRPIRSAVEGAVEGAGASGSMTVTPGSMPVVDVDEAAELAGSTSGVLLDARAAARFRGEIEPIDPVAGHIPGALNLPITDLLAPDGRFRPAAEIGAALRAVGLGLGTDGAPGGSAAASCGSGVTACQLILAGEIVGLPMALYAGSYSQWCSLGRPVAVGSS